MRTVQLRAMGIVLAVLVGGCGDAPAIEDAAGSTLDSSAATLPTQPPTTTTSASTTTQPPPPASSTSTTAPVNWPDLSMACGYATAPYASSPPTAQWLDDDATAALAALAANAEGSHFAENYEWGIWEKSDEELVLLGTAPSPGSPDGPQFADVSFERRDGSWVPRGWGSCHWEARADPYGVAEWIIDPSKPPTADATAVGVLVTERNCASGELPEGREVLPIVMASDTEIIVFVLVEPITGIATCPSNPSFELTVEIGEPIGGRTLLDGHTIPATPRH